MFTEAFGIVFKGFHRWCPTWVRQGLSFLLIQCISMAAIPDAHEIVPGIWLGNKRASENAKWMKDQGITVVFNATKDLPFSTTIKQQYRIPVDDNLQPDEIRNMELWSFEIIYKLIRERKKEKPILVHCAAGMQRSAAVVAMYLITTENMTWDQAHRHIKQRRPIAFYPSANFEKAIVGFYNSFQRDIRPNLEE
jgi:protein-tyrosine phosphatase